MGRRMTGGDMVVGGHGSRQDDHLTAAGSIRWSEWRSMDLETAV